MKLLPLIAALMLCMGVQAQTPKIVTENGKYYRIDSLKKEVNLTPVIMLVSRQGETAYQTSGYKVSEKHGLIISSGMSYYSTGNDLLPPDYCVYLDSDKKPLDKSITVWISKEIKP